jgi:hypothetical protein
VYLWVPYDCHTKQRLFLWTTLTNWCFLWVWCFLWGKNRIFTYYLDEFRLQRIKTHFNIILPYMPKSPKQFLPFRFPILNHTNTVYTFIPNFFKIYFNIILPSTPTSDKWPVFFAISDQNFACIIFLMSATCPTLFIHHDLMTLTGGKEPYQGIQYTISLPMYPSSIYILNAMNT